MSRKKSCYLDLFHIFTINILDLNSNLFAVIDVETTGHVHNGRMTEVCIILIKDGNIIDKYTSLINPECDIPTHITALTGIDNEMVINAPTFAEIAPEIDHFTKDAIFVAHNVNFDFGFFKKEFANLGTTYHRKKLCTVRLSRKLIPGLPSYSLGRLTKSVGITLVGAHRAEADTVATAHLFIMLLEIDAKNDYQVFKKSLNIKSREGTLPPHLPAEYIKALPEFTGVYLFKNQAEKVIYVGKAKNIKSRVLSHLYSKVAKEIALAQETYHIDFEETGNELAALLLESEYIRAFYPAHNRAQKRPTKAYQIISYENRSGIIQLAIGQTKNTQDSIVTLYTKAHAMEQLEQLCEQFNLCPRFCTLQTNVVTCSHYKIKNCKGICEDKETPIAYNKRVQQAIHYIENEKPTYVIKGRGRTIDETNIILVEKGQYKGMGYINDEETITNFEDFQQHISLYKNTYHSHKIITNYLKKNEDHNIVYNTSS